MAKAITESIRSRARQLREEARPASPVGPDLDTVRRLALLQCTIAEVASFFELPESFLVDSPGVMDAYEVGIQKGRRSLRRKLMQMALAGDRALLVWLSKNYLSMKDSGSIALGGSDKPLAVELGVDAGVLAEALAILASAGALREDSPNGHAKVRVG
tara:strand:- start:514 stop:987 length:474 start_codon:yes stop_codon:yes gene_type:complete